MRPILKRAVGLTALSLLMPCAHISAQLAAGANNQRTSAALERLQGTWQGVMVGQESAGQVTITITGNSLHFFRDANFWFETIFTLPVGTDPQQLHATIQDSAESQGDAMGEVVVAILKIEDEILTLVALGDEETPESFEAAEYRGLSRYELRQVQPQM